MWLFLWLLMVLNSEFDENNERNEQSANGCFYKRNGGKPEI